MTVEGQERAVRRVGLVLMILAAMALGGSMSPAHEPIPALWEGWGLFAVPALLAACAFGPRRLAALVPLALFLRPFAAAALAGALGGRVPMLEVILLAAVQDLGLGLAVLPRRRSGPRLAVLISLFLVLVAATTGEGAALLGLVVAYATLGTFWLMLISWAGAARGAALPRSGAAWVLGVVATIASVAAIGPSRAATALAGLVPTSGGTGLADPEARGGVNDGDAEVDASESPKSTGFTRSEIYLDSERPSLFDTFNETYGEPFKPKELKRMIAVSPDKVTEQRDRPAENLRAGREFPLVRRRPGDTPRAPRSRAADALVYVQGPTPLHLRLTVFDRFDGRTWREEEPGVAVGDGRPRAGPSGGWLLLKTSEAPIFAGTVGHRIKIGRLDSSALPVPAHLERFRIGDVGPPNMFALEPSGVLRMAGRTAPSGTVIETEARLVDPHLLAAFESPASYYGGPRYDGRVGGYQPDPRVVAAGEFWSAGLPRGGPQVAAVVRALRRTYVHDRSAVASADCRDVVADFLLRSGRGPDYLFASSAVVLLRSIGYPARLVGGFYASPRRYDLRARHTPVLERDAHVWAEVQLPGGTWVAIEPTPGYHLPTASPSLAARLAAVVALAGRAAREHAAGLAGGILILALAYWFRRELLDCLATLAWRLGSTGTWPRLVLATLALVERRSRWAGRPRPLPRRRPAGMGQSPPRRNRPRPPTWIGWYG